MGFSRQEYGVGCHSLLQGIFQTQGSNPGLLHCRQTLYCLSHWGSPWQVNKRQTNQDPWPPHRHLLWISTDELEPPTAELSIYLVNCAQETLWGVERRLPTYSMEVLLIFLMKEEPRAYWLYLSDIESSSGSEDIRIQISWVNRLKIQILS